MHRPFSVEACRLTMPEACPRRCFSWRLHTHPRVCCSQYHLTGTRMFRRLGLIVADRNVSEIESERASALKVS